jgi:hypothetical protein
LLAAAWEYAGKYRTDDEGPRAPFAQYLVWNSVYKAKRFVHRARGVSLNGKVTHPDAAKGVRVDSMDDEKYAHKSICGTIDAYQERQVERARVRAKLAELPLTVAQVLTMGALIAADLNVEGGAVLLYNDPEARLACRLGAEGEALRLARATIREVAKKNDKRSKKVSASV